MQKKSYITPTLRIKEVQLTLLETMSGRDQGWGDLDAKSARNKKPYYDDEYFYDDYVDFEIEDSEENK